MKPDSKRTKTLQDNVLSTDAMNTELHTLFSEHIQNPDGLFEEVLFAIQKRQQKDARERKYIWGILSLLSIAAVWTSGAYALRVFGSSSFGNYFSLIFSDLRSISPLWKELGLSLIESLPIVGIAIFLASVSAVLLSLRRFSRYASGHTIRAQAPQAA